MFEAFVVRHEFHLLTSGAIIYVSTSDEFNDCLVIIVEASRLAAHSGLLWMHACKYKITV